LYYLNDNGFPLPDVADNITIRVVDEDGSYIETTIETQSNDVSVTTGLRAATVGAVGNARNVQQSFSLGSGSSALRAAALRASLVVGGAVFLESVTQSYGDEVEGGSVERRLQPNPVPDIRAPSAWPSGLEITLPSGTVYGDAPTIGDGRGYGRDFIIETTAIETVDEIEQIIRAPNTIIERGPYDGYIGENPNGGGEVIIWVIDGYAVAAEQTIEREREEEISDAVEDLNEEREQDNQLDEEEVQNEVNDGPEQVNDGVRNRINIHRIAEGVRILIRTVGPGTIVRIVAEQFQRDDEEDEDESVCGLSSGDIDMSVTADSRRQFVAAPSGYTLFEGQFQETTNPVDVDYRCVDDREAVVQTYADNPNDLSDGTLGENVTVELIRERQNLELRFPPGGFDPNDTATIGPDAIAYDANTGEYVIIEAKTSNSTDAVGIGLLSDAYNGSTQLSDEWIRASITELQQRGQIDSELANDVLNATAAGNVRKEIVFARDNPDAVGRTLTTPQRNDTDISRDSVVGVDRVTIIELQAPTTNQSANAIAYRRAGDAVARARG